MRAKSLGLLALVFALGAGPIFAQTSGELAALKKRLADLESRTNRLEEENQKLLNSSLADAPSSAEKIKLTGPVKELILYGDLGLRYQWDNSQATYYVNPKGEAVTEHGEQRSRWRFRLRLNADFQLTDGWFGGVGLASNQTPDSGYTTFDGGFRNYDVYLSRAFVGWNASDWATFIAGKQPNPFYTTELLWDLNINPVGVVEQIRLHKLFGWGGEASGATPAFELALLAGQLFFDDNNEYNLYSDNNRDATIFEQQLIASYRFSNNTKVTIAPAFLAYNAAKSAPVNVAPFSKKNDGLPLWVGESRGLAILQVPGDVSFDLFGRKAKFLWDFSYNFRGEERVRDVYGLTSDPVPLVDASGSVVGFLPGATHSSRDDFAWLVGLQFGENRKKNDWSVFLNYREVGLAAVDPNINEGTWGASRTNLRGFRGGIAYNFTDFTVASVTYMQADRIRKDLYGGEATGGARVADLHLSQILQFDLNVKF